jgi:hypothetical protein
MTKKEKEVSWEKHGANLYYYRVQRDPHGRLVKQYCGTGAAAKRAADEDDRKRAARKRAHMDKQYLQQLDAQLNTLTKITQTFAQATLLGAGYHQYKRQWRKWRQHTLHSQEGEYAMQEHLLTLESSTYDHLAHLVSQAQQGDTTILPVLRTLLDQVPELWHDSRVLAHQVERSWIRVLSGQDMVSQEIIEREVQALRHHLLGAQPSPLERLLVDRICACWLALQHAELHAAKRLNGHTVVLSTAEEHRLDATHRRFLLAVRELARVRKLLRPETKVQVNIGAQQIVA